MKAVERFQYYLEKDPDRRFYIDIPNDRIYTRGEFFRDALKLASWLKSLGIGRLDKIAVILPNSIEFALFYFAGLYSQLTIVPLNPILHPSEVEYILKSCRPRAVFYSSSTADMITPGIEEKFRGSLYGIKIRQEAENEFAPRGALFTSDEIFSSHSPGTVDPAGITDDHILTITYTSGTTQTPKGVMHRFENFVNNAWNFVSMMGIGEENSFYGVLSQAYMGGFYNLFLLPWISGATIAFGKSFDALSAITFWDAPMKYRLNTLWLVPTIMAVLLKVDRSKSGRDYAKENIRLALAGTAPLPVKLRKDFEERYQIGIFENYGLSEILFVTSNSPLEPVVDGSVGKPLEGISLSIRNESGASPPLRGEGEIFVKTADCMAGYFRESAPGRELEMAEGEWFATGDVGYLDEEGRLFITGRKKDLIIRGGINISPKAIENVIMEHAAIGRAAVVGIPHDIYGEDIAAVVELKPGYSLETVQNDLEMMCREKLGNVRKPSVFFEIEEFPMSSTGKIQKNKLRLMLKAKLEK